MRKGWSRKLKCVFFPRASERRVLLIVGVCETSSHLHIFSSSHLLIFTYLSIFSSSHPHIFTSVHPHIFSSSHLHILSCSLALLLPPSFLFLSWRRGAVPTRRHEMQPFRTKWGSIAENWSKIAICKSVRRNPFARNEVRSPKTEIKLQFVSVRRNPFARNEVRSPKTEIKLRFAKRPAQPFRTKWGSIAKNCSNIAICKYPGATLSHEMKFDRQKLS